MYMVDNRLNVIVVLMIMMPLVREEDTMIGRMVVVTAMNLTHLIQMFKLPTVIHIAW